MITVYNFTVRVLRIYARDAVVVRRVLTPQTLEEQLKRLVQVVDCVCVDVQRAQNIYNKLFYR